MHSISSALSDSASLQLLTKVVVLTLFYAALAWLPLRGTALAMRRYHESAERKRRERLLRGYGIR
jgi:hypothetical protein